MNSKISILMLLIDNDLEIESLYSILNQSFSNWELYILSDLEKIDNLLDVKNDTIHVIKYTSKNDIFNTLISFACTLPGQYISLCSSTDINRLRNQLNFMNLNNANICSCLERMINEVGTVYEYNNFITDEEICQAISSYYLPLDLYTFMIRKDFLVKLSYFSYAFNFTCEIDLILYFLRYDKIKKIPEELYYVRKPRLPYKECVNYHFSLTSSNKLVVFNRNNILYSQGYFNEIINNELPNCPTNCKFKCTFLIILDNINIGGTETYVLNLSNKLRKVNIDTCILTNNCLSPEVFVLNQIPLYIFDLNNYDKLQNIFLKFQIYKL